MRRACARLRRRVARAGDPALPACTALAKWMGWGRRQRARVCGPGLACRRTRHAAAERLRCARRAPARRMPTPAACAARRGGSARSKLAVGTPPISRRRVGLKDLSAGHCHAGTKVIISLGRANGAARRYRLHVRACARAQHANGQRAPERRAGTLRWGAWACAAQAHRARVVKCKDAAAMKRPGQSRWRRASSARFDTGHSSALTHKALVRLHSLPHVLHAKLEPLRRVRPERLGITHEHLLQLVPLIGPRHRRA